MIAAELGRSASTVSRELRRNTDPDSGRYYPFRAHQLAVARRARPGRARLLLDVELRRAVEQGLEKRWSPEQIARALPAQFPDQPDRHLVHETIYQAIYRAERGGLSRDLPRVLRTRRRRRRPHPRPDARRHRSIPGMISIRERPVEADGRHVPGHWEGDLIVGTTNRSAIGTLVERTTKFTVLVHLPEGRRTAEAMRDGVIRALGPLPVSLRRSLAWDQGTEMALHHEITRRLDLPVFFCDKASPWQRGVNENTNGLLRQYFPKGTDLSPHTPEELAAVAAELNNRPRKTLNWRTPADLFSALTDAALPSLTTC